MSVMKCAIPAGGQAIRFFFMRSEGGIYGGLCYYAVRRGVYKLVQNTPYEELQLFNIADNP